MRAGGAAAFFAAVFFINPPALIANQNANDAIRRGDAAFANGEYQAALDFFSEAARADPKSWVAYNGLGRTKFELGDFYAAKEYFQTAFDKGGQLDGNQMYNIGLCLEAIGDNEGARLAFSKTLKLSLPGSSMANEARFSHGETSLAAWLKNEAPKETDTFKDAVQDFRSFLQNNGEPQQWAFYDLACLYASRSQDSLLDAGGKMEFQRAAEVEISHAVAVLAQYKGSKAPTQKNLMVSILRRPESFKQAPGDPPPCKAIPIALMNLGRSVDSVIEPILGS